MRASAAGGNVFAIQDARAAVTARSAARRLRSAKLLCALILGVCFWFAVPYLLPLQLDADPAKAAASEAQAHEGSPSRQIAMPVVLLTSLYMLWRLPKRGRFRRDGKLLYLVLSYITFAVISCLWSVDPAISCKRVGVFLINVCFMYALARTASMLEIALFGFVSTGLVALIALFADAVLLHSFAPGDPDYRFMGVMTANFQAMNLVVCLLCGITLAQYRPRWIRWLLPLLTLFSGLLLLTRARVGSFLCLGMIVVVLWRMAKVHLAPGLRATVLVSTCTLVLPALLYALGATGGNAVTSVFMMGRQDTENTSSLSNRAPLWGELVDSVQQRPLLGFGFEAFWSAERVQSISRDQGWVVPHAHNTYLDQTLSLGVPGALFYVCVLWGGCAVAWRRYQRTPDERSLLPVLLLSWLALLGLTESVPVSPYLPTLIAYACIVKLCMVEGSEAEGSAAEDKGGTSLLLGSPGFSLTARRRRQETFA